MKQLLITLIALACLAGCSGEPPSLVDVYEGLWIDESIPLTLNIALDDGASFSYELSTGGVTLLDGILFSYPDHTVMFAYTDGGQRRIEFTGIINGDTLNAKFTHTGLGYDNVDVEMGRGK